jgi:hypothetical protein
LNIQITEIPDQDYKSPILNYCRKLLREGVHPRTTLKVYRGKVLAMHIKTIRLGAKWTVREDDNRGPCFIKYRPFLRHGRDQGEEK